MPAEEELEWVNPDQAAVVIGKEGVQPTLVQSVVTLKASALPPNALRLP